MRYQCGKMVVTEQPHDLDDFIIWCESFAGEGRAKLIACTERAHKWCLANEDDLPGSIYEEMDDDDAEKLRERLVAAGFKVLGFS